MKKFISKIHTSTSRTPTPNAPNTTRPTSPLDVLRYRYHHGTNLGSIFLLEKWLFPTLLPPSPYPSEHSLIRTSLSTHGLAHTTAILKAHYLSALTNADIQWLVEEARVTSIRLPIGYWILGKRFCEGTVWEDVADVYDHVNAWGEVRKLIRRARSAGIGVLVDIHGLPGGANGDAHSGIENGEARLWGNADNLRVATEVCVFVAGEVKGMEREGDGVVGIQIVNEACWGAGKRGMYGWYEEVIARIADVDGDIPVYVSDAWDLEGCLRWVNERRVIRGEEEYPRNPVVVDAHRYYTFAEKYRSQTPQEIIARIPGELGQLKGKEGSLVSRGEAQVIIGEWSCVMDERTWKRVKPEEKEEYTRQFGQAQSRKWQEKAGGSYFWTMKMSWMDGGGWGFVEQTKKGNISPPPWLLLSLDEVRSRAQDTQAQRAQLAQRARESHEAYWTKTSPGKKFEHHLYSEGWEVGFSDAQSFFTMRADGGLPGSSGGDKIGCLEVWVKKRLLESGERGGFAWEWEQGMRAGVAAFNQAVGI